MEANKTLAIWHRTIQQLLIHIVSMLKHESLFLCGISHRQIFKQRIRITREGLSSHARTWESDKSSFISRQSENVVISSKFLLAANYDAMVALTNITGTFVPMTHIKSRSFLLPLYNCGEDTADNQRNIYHSHMICSLFSSQKYFCSYSSVLYAFIYSFFF